MKKTTAMIAKVVLYSLLLTACHKNNGSNPAQYFPNAPGDFWVYDVTDSAASSPNNPSTPRHYSVKVLVTGSKVLADGNTAAVWQYQYPWGNDTNFVRLSGDTLKIFSLVYSRTVSDLAYPRVIFLLPLQVSNRWNGLLLNIDSSRVMAESAITLPSFPTFSGCFEIYHHYIGPNTEYNDYYWFKPNLGMISIRYNDYNNGPTLYRRWVMTNYHIQ